MFEHAGDYELGIWPMQAADVTEIDSLRELAAEDSRYQVFLEDERNAKNII